MFGRWKLALGSNAFTSEVEHGRIFELARELRFDGVQLHKFQISFRSHDEGRLRNLLMLSKVNGLEINGLEYDFKGHPAGSKKETRLFVESIQKNLDLLKRLGGKHLCIGAGELPKGLEESVAYERLVETFAECGELAKKAEKMIVLEAEPPHIIYTAEKFVRIIEDTNSPNFKALFDTSHANIFTKGRPLKLLRNLGNLVGYVHLVDSDGTLFQGTSRHLALGEGKLDFTTIMAALKDGGYQGWVAIELWLHPKPFEGYAHSKKYLDNL